MAAFSLLALLALQSGANNPLQPLDDPPGEGTPESRSAANASTELLQPKNTDTDKRIGEITDRVSDPCNKFVRDYYMRVTETDKATCKICDVAIEDQKFFKCMPKDSVVQCEVGSPDQFFEAEWFGMVCRGGDKKCNVCCQKGKNLDAIEWANNQTCCRTDEKPKDDGSDGSLPTCSEPADTNTDTVKDLVDVCNIPVVTPFFKAKAGVKEGGCRKCKGLLPKDDEQQGVTQLANANMARAEKYFKCVPDTLIENVHCRANITTPEAWHETKWYGVQCRGTPEGVVDSIKYKGCQICCSKEAKSWLDKEECCCNGDQCEEGFVSCKAYKDLVDEGIPLPSPDAVHR